jgi:hypothetical protein
MIESERLRMRSRPCRSRESAVDARGRATRLELRSASARQGGVRHAYDLAEVLARRDHARDLGADHDGDDRGGADDGYDLLPFVVENADADFRFHDGYAR